MPTLLESYLDQNGANQRQTLGNVQQAQGIMGVLAQQTQLQEMQQKIQQEALKQAALRGLLSTTPQGALSAGGATAPTGPTGLSDTSANSMGAPWAAASNIPQPPAPIQTQAPRFNQDQLTAAAASGVNIEPFLKLNAEGRPDVMHVDLGDKVRIIDKKTMRVLGEVPKGNAPGSKPYEGGDLSPEDYRKFLLEKQGVGATKNITNVNAYTPASEAAQKDFMDKVSKRHDALQSAPVFLQNIEEAKKLVPGAKGFMGPGGEPLLETAKFLNNRLGMQINTEGVKDAEELRTRLFVQVMENLKKMDAQPSQYQQKVMQDAFGTLGTDPNAVPRILDAFGDIVRGKVDLHNKEVQSAAQRGVKFPYDPIITLPEKQKPESAPGQFDKLPSPLQLKGKTIRDTETGKLFKSDGMSWREAK